eukprot:NODE_38_length_35257_cov_0.939047.p21 type:complete len:197 gc:universal NODE_38_length_35257_cov_0.939047:12559-13149(+)
MSIVIEPEALEYAENKLREIIYNIEHPNFKAVHIDELVFSKVECQLLGINDPKEVWYGPQQQRNRYDTFISSKTCGSIKFTGGFTLNLDYPETVPFIGLPINLEIDLSFNFIAYVVYIEKSIKISIRGISNLETGTENLIKSCTVRSTIGDVNKLRNLKSIEIFIQKLIEQGINEEMGYPNYMEVRLFYDKLDLFT